MMRTLLLTLTASLALTAQAQTSSATATTQAQWMLNRLTGVRWAANSPLIAQMAAKIQAGDQMGAAEIATQQPQFYNITVKQMALALSTRAETTRLPLNDFAASFIGVTRDAIDARQLLFGSFYYAADPTKIPAGVTIRSNLANDMILTNNHYADLDSNNVDFSAVLKQYPNQMLVTSSAGATAANPDPAGVLTSRAFIQAHAIAGTNRRLVEYTFREFMCIPLINWADTQASDARIGRDVDRYPGNSNTTYETSCKGCHSVQDGFRGAFAKWDWNAQDANLTGGTGNAIYSAFGGSPGISVDGNGISTKMNKNNTVYPNGFVTTDDSWMNFATRGVNSTLFGWRGQAPAGGDSSAGKGTNQFGRLVANSQRFSQCMAQHVFQSVCQKNLSDADAQVHYVSLGLSFEAANYNLKKLFETVATNAKCQN